VELGVEETFCWAHGDTASIRNPTKKDKGFRGQVKERSDSFAGGIEDLRPRLGVCCQWGKKSVGSISC